MSFQRYPAYRDSGVEWLGEVPAHWEVVPVSYRYEVQLGKMLDGNKVTGEHLRPYLRVFDVQWDKINVDDLPEMDFDQEDRIRYRLKAGDLLVNEGGSYVGRSAVWRGEMEECYYQKALHRLRPHDKAADTAEFFLFVMENATRQGVFVARGNQATIEHLTAEALRRYRFAFPPRQEQEDIAAFLRRETERYGALVTEQEKLIDLLKEKRQAVISRAVTKGLDPQVPMKDSGIAWLGEVPAHWRTGQIRAFARLESGHTPSRQHPEYWENCTIPWFSLADVWQIREEGRRYVYDTSELVSELGLANSSARLLPKGTVILSRTASVGFSAIMGRDMATTQDFANWVCGKDLLPEFLLCVLRGMRSEFDRLMMGSTHKTIYMPDIAALALGVPPLDEQKAIVSFLDSEFSRIDALITEAQKAITLLKERRAALISAAVTGRIDVRDRVAAGVTEAA